MDLATVAGSPVPEGAVVGTVRPDSRTELRVAHWPPKPGRPVRGTVVIGTGRSEFIEKYFETVRDLQARGFAAVVFDWQGQGLSTRTFADRRKGHVADFDHYIRDLEAVVRLLLLPHCPSPYFALGHSMGGAIVALYGTRADCLFSRIVLSAPMVEVHNLPFPRHLARLTGGLSRLGFGGAFAPRGQVAAVFDRGFEGNVLTSDAARFETMMAFAAANPELTVGAPTIGWLYAAFVAMQRLNDLDVCRSIRTPVLVVVPGADRVISVPAMERFAQRLKAAMLVRVPYSRHEILMERDALRSQFWAAFDAFVPGEVEGDESRLAAD